MFILFHLLTGLVLGYLLADRLGTRAVVLPCMLGALLPDLVDKPLGILVLGGELGSGRIYLHTLLFLVLFLLAGGVAFARYHRPGLLAAGVGAASHQVLDLMWLQPKAWLFPFLGRFPPIETEGWFLRALLLELRDPLEYVSGGVLLLLLLPVLWPAGTSALVARYGRLLRLVALAGVPLFGVPGLLFIAAGLLGRARGGLGWEAAGNAILAGAVLLLTAYVAYRLASRLAGGAGPAVPLRALPEAPPAPGPRE
jgi:hypothetical protein